MHSATKPFHVFDMRTRWLYATVVSVLLSVLLAYENLVVYPPAPGSASNAITSLLIPIGLPAYCIWRYIKVVRIEFYEQFVRVVRKGGAANVDAPYPDLEIGPLAKSGMSWAYSFQISLKGRSEGKAWNVQNSKLSGTNKTLYMSVQEHVADARTAPSPAPNPSSITGPTSPSGIKQPWLMVVVIGLLMMAFAIFVSGAPGWVLFIIGLILLYVSRMLRSRQIRSETSH